MKQHKYTEEQKSFLKENCSGTSYSELTDIFNNEFNLDLSLTKIQGAMKRYGLKNGLDRRFKKGDIPFNKGKKGIRVSPGTEFKKGHIPKNYLPVGSERITKDGYLEVKIKKPNVWKLKHRIVWEKENGPVPKGFVVIFSDQDKTNISIDNLLVVSRRELAVMNHEKLIYDNSDLTKTGKNIASLKIKINDVIREKK